ncbi:hypothetical protein OCU04_012937 [Sclerotinia nivalis]|uniref:G-patch domain-containing protein n=1 Tax=Sclerotinia nivalis TaxID=352851 RepID=A0A9X0AC03_9HELO|nr:hypothetical protein OCU04_012937 [Sclerotinia nivalis]
MSMNAFPRDSSDESSSDENDFLHPSTDPREEFADYNPRKRRRTGRNAKESAALGVFGSESEDEGGPGKRWKKKSLRGKGMSFVAGGERAVEDDEEDDDEDDDDDKAVETGANNGKEDADMEDDEEESNAPRGLGFGAAGQGLGFQSPAPTKSKNIGLGSNTSTPLGRGFVPSSANNPILLNDDDPQDLTPRIARPSAFSTPSNGRGGNKAGGGATPVNSMSFAARMMAKMGYKEGQGLGKEGQGRSGVIEVTLRPQGVGLGSVAEKSKQEKEEEKRQAKLRGEKIEDSDEERRKRRRKPKTSGTDSGMSGVSTPRKAAKPKYRTVEEVQRAAPGLEIPEAFAPILDMTGPGQKLLTSTSGLLTPTAGPPKTESVEEIENRKLARRAQNDLSAFVEEWKNLEERKAYTEMELIQQQQELDEEQRQYEQMKLFAESIQGIAKAVQDGQWDPVIEALKTVDGLDISGANEELSNIAVAAVHPFLRQASEGWQPLEDPKLNGMVPNLYKIRHILGAVTDDKAIVSQDSFMNASHKNRVKSTTPYESMIYKIIFPKIVSSINKSWDVYNPAPVLAFLDAWQGLLPKFVRSQILDQAIVGKLNDAVSSWNPKKRRNHELPHLWLFPWLQYLPAYHADPKSSTGLVSDVKRKFRHLIDSWDFHRGVIPGLEQWREVLHPSSNNDTWTPLIMNHVLPSMAKFLKNEKNFLVDPNDQAPYMSSLQGIFAWKDILKSRIVGQVLIETVFPMWHNVLHQWLTVVGHNVEIGQWFKWWRDSVFPAEIRDLREIQQEFEKGHEMIKRALALGEKAKTHLPAPGTSSTSSQSTQIPLSEEKPKDKQISEDVSFREKIEDWCIENDLQFLPEKKVLHSAGPLYRVTAAGNGKGGVLVYFRGEKLVALQSRGGGKEKVEVGIEWEREEGRDVLLGMAWVGVK